ncbi:MAG TPA: hypothetical protein VIK11_10850 [Tepidiformaceae bacterium]|jgi:hypothetical protein
MQRTERPQVVHRRRRNNAPVRPYRRASAWPDLVLALALTGLTMGLVFFVLSFVDHSAKAEADLARLFATALVLMGLFLLALAFGLSGTSPDRLAQYAFPALLGLIVGGLESILFLAPALLALPLPFLLFVTLFGPFRRRIDRMATPGRRVTG